MELKMSRDLKKIKGITLIELMITLAIAGVLLATAAPSMREFIQNNGRPHKSTNYRPH